MTSKNISNFELCQQLKAAGYPQPTSEFGQLWYAEPHGRLCVSTNNGSKVGPGNPYFSETATPSRLYGVTGFVYAPTVIEMAEYSKGRSSWQIKELFKLWADGEPTRQDIANDMARFVLWLIEWRKQKDAIKGAAARFCENMQSLNRAAKDTANTFDAPPQSLGNFEWKKANPTLIDEYHRYTAPVNIPDVGDAYQQGPHTVIKDKDGGFILSNTKVGDAVKLFESVKKFDEANPVPFYKTDEYKAKKEAQEKEKAEKDRMYWQSMFEPGNVILVCFGRDGDNVQDMLVLGHDFGIEHVKLQNKEGVSFWKKRKHVFVKSILANINHPINPSVERLIEAFLPKVNTYTAGEKIGANEPVFVDSSGKLMRSDGPITPTEPKSK